jgi:hypothetical protein
LALRPLILLIAASSFSWSASSIRQAQHGELVHELARLTRAGERLSDRGTLLYNRWKDQNGPASCSKDLPEAVATIEAGLAQRALQSGDVEGFDAHFDRFARNISLGLLCSPHRPVHWFFRFAADAAAGRLNSESWKAVALSYHLGPNEAWLMLVRNSLVLRQAESAPLDVRSAALEEFSRLVANGFTGSTATSFARASSDVQRQLGTALQNVDVQILKRFTRELEVRQ